MNLIKAIIASATLTALQVSIYIISQYCLMEQRLCMCLCRYIDYLWLYTGFPEINPEYFSNSDFPAASGFDVKFLERLVHYYTRTALKNENPNTCHQTSNSLSVLLLWMITCTTASWMMRYVYTINVDCTIAI